MMKVMSFKISEKDENKLNTLAAKYRVNKSWLIRSAINMLCDKVLKEKTKGE